LGDRRLATDVWATRRLGEKLGHLGDSKKVDWATILMLLC
jgi:hypothetical protein